MIGVLRRGADNGSRIGSRTDLIDLAGGGGINHRDATGDRGQLHPLIVGCPTGRRTKAVPDGVIAAKQAGYRIVGLRRHRGTVEAVGPHFRCRIPGNDEVVPLPIFELAVDVVRVERSVVAHAVHGELAEIRAWFGVIGISVEGYSKRAGEKRAKPTAARAGIGGRPAVLDPERQAIGPVVRTEEKPARPGHALRQIDGAPDRA